MAEQNVIEVVLRSVDQLSQDLKRVEGDLRRFEQAGAKVETRGRGITQSSIGLRQALGPTTNALRQMTTAVAVLNPQFGVLITSFDNLIFAMVRAASTAKTAGAGILLALRAAFNPITIGVLAAVAAITFFVKRFLDSKEVIENAQKSISSVRVELQKLGVPSEAGKIEVERRARIDEFLRQQREGAIAGFEPITEAAKRTQIEAINREQDLKLAQLRQQIREKAVALNRELIEQRIKLGALEAEEIQHAQELIQITSGIAPHEILEKRVELLNREIEEAIKRTPELERELIRLRGVQLQILEIEDRLERFKRAEREMTPLQRQIEEEADNPFAVVERALAQDLGGLVQRAQEEGERVASAFANTMTERIISFMEGGKMDIANALTALGKSIVSMVLQQLLKEAIVQPVTQMILGNLLRGGAPTGGGGGGGFGGLLNIFSMFSSLFGGGGGILEYARGGMVLPSSALRKFQSGGVVRGPTLGVIGEEGPEIVARMKPMRPQDEAGDAIKQNIFLVDRRPSRLGPNDVVLIVADDMVRGGPTSRGVTNVIRRRT